MNKNIIIASAITAGAAALFLLIKKMRANSNKLQELPVPRSRHMTDTFARAKHIAGKVEEKSLEAGI